MDWDDRSGPRRKCSLKRARIHGCCVWLDVAQDRTSTSALDCGDSGDARVGLRHHLVAWTNLQSPQGKLDRVRAGPDTYGVFCTAPVGKLAFECSALLTEDEPSPFQNSINRDR